MADVQAKPKARIIHTLYDIQQPLRIVLQNIFQHDLHTGVCFQKFLPKHNGLLHIPNRKINPGIVTAVDNHFLRAISFGQINCLPVTVGRQLSGFFINGAGKQFIIGRMKQSLGNALQFLFDHTVHRQEFLIHIPGGAVFCNFQTKAVFPRDLRSFCGNGGKIDVFSFHNPCLAFQKRYCVQSSKPKGIRQNTV